MRKTLLIITALMLMLGCSSEPIDVDKLVEREGLLYKQFSESPFTGEVIYLDLNSQPYENEKLFMGKVSNGKKIGKWKYWHSNGQKKEEGTYKNGKLDGKMTKWFENGQKGYEGIFKDGKLHGLWTEWYENGQKKKEGTYKDGEQIGKTKWY